ncbi:MAG: hypothetical protein Q9219_004722 [cf. Caloplaca sp. 3 TL-2023]
MSDFYRQTLHHRGNGPISGGIWHQQWQNLQLDITQVSSSGQWRLTYADAFFGLAWMLVSMNNIKLDRFSEYTGFWENTYHVLRKTVYPYHHIGDIDVEMIDADAHIPMFQHPPEIPATATYTNFSAFTSLNLSDSDSTPTVVTPLHLPNPYPVPDSDVILLFTPPSKPSPIPRPLMLELFHSLFLQIYIILLRRRSDNEVPAQGFQRPSVSMWVAPRKDTSLFTSSTLVDAVIGMVSWMVVEGFTAGEFTVVKPDAKGKRVTVGSIRIVAGAGTAVA